MNLPFDFDYYLVKGIVNKTSKNIPRAEFLINESSKSMIGLKTRIDKLGIDEFNANSIIKDSQDIILEMIRAKMFLEGFSASGNFAHEAEISYLTELGFPEKEVSFANELRAARNGINYYGKLYEVEYAKKVVDFLMKVYPKLKEKLLL
jgi:hypothetical protein